MKQAIRSAVPILVALLVTVLVVSLTGVTVTQTSHFPAVAALAVAILAVVAGVRHWTTLPWLPWAGLVIAAAGYAANNQLWMHIALFGFSVMTVWHEHQHESRIRRSGTAVVQ